MTRALGRCRTFAMAALGVGLWAAPARAQSGPSNASDESQDSGLGLEWVYLNADVGFSYVDMASLSSSSLGLAETSGSGLTWGAGAGVRLFFLSAGARVRNTLLSDPGSLWTLDLEAALHMRIWRIDPYFGVRGGYAWVGSMSSNAVTTATGMSQPDVAVHGFDVGPTLGLDIYFSSLFSIGAEAQASFLFLQRPKLSLPPEVQAAMMSGAVTLTPQEQELYNNSGSSVGFAGTVVAHAGLHF
jgi:hypothetical protein